MSKKGENIYKRKDGRWEGRYVKSYDINGKPQLGYTASIDLTKQYNIHSIAFSSISAGKFNYPKEAACEIAVNSVMQWLDEHNNYKI